MPNVIFNPLSHSSTTVNIGFTQEHNPNFLRESDTSEKSQRTRYTKENLPRTKTRDLIIKRRKYDRVIFKESKNWKDSIRKKTQNHHESMNPIKDEFRTLINNINLLDKKSPFLPIFKKVLARPRKRGMIRSSSEKVKFHRNQEKMIKKNLQTKEHLGQAPKCNYALMKNSFHPYSKVNIKNCGFMDKIFDGIQKENILLNVTKMKTKIPKQVFSCYKNYLV